MLTDQMSGMSRNPTVAEFFAGVGLVRMALEEAGFRVVFANDISAKKREMYALNFGDPHFLLSDIRAVLGAAVPDVDVATASFPCTDMSLAGGRAGLNGRESGLLWEFFRVIREMRDRQPRVVLIENVPGFATSNGGTDILAAFETLNELGYYCDAIVLDAKRFVPQSRQRLFVIGASHPPASSLSPQSSSPLRPNVITRLLASNGHLRTFSLATPRPPESSRQTIEDVVEPLPPDHVSWWGEERMARFLSSLSQINTRRASALRRSPRLAHATAYRRTRSGKAVWEIRGDNISGCLRTARGGSSKQALVEGGNGFLRVRWMTAKEYARLQGAPTFQWGVASELQAQFALGDAVCVPAVAWLAKNYLLPLMADTQYDVRSPVVHRLADLLHVY